jgi:hypothetical protein
MYLNLTIRKVLYLIGRFDQVELLNMQERNRKRLITVHHVPRRYTFNAYLPILVVLLPAFLIYCLWILYLYAPYNKRSQKNAYAVRKQEQMGQFESKPTPKATRITTIEA